MKIPDIDDIDLAYETGLSIGDGCLCKERNNTYRFGYYGNNNDERQFFNKIIIPLMKKLYGFKLKLGHSGNTCFVRICSKRLLEFKSGTVGLPVGKKDKLKALPKIFMRRHILAINLIAGLFDTDGSIYTSRGRYPRVSLALKNMGIIREVKVYLGTLGIKSLIRCNRHFDERVNKAMAVWILEINGFRRFRLFLEHVPIRNTKYKKRIEKLFKLENA